MTEQAQLFEDDQAVPGLPQQPQNQPVLAAPASVTPAPKARPTARFLFAHPAHFIALGAGSGLSKWAPGTAGTLWAWASFLVLAPFMTDLGWAAVLTVGTLVAWWASTVAARNLNVMDPGCIVIDEIIAFWLVLGLAMPTDLGGQFAAFCLFRFFDAVKPPPVGWADGLFKGFGPRGGWGIVFDDLVAAFMTLLVLAVWRFYQYNLL